MNAPRRPSEPPGRPRPGERPPARRAAPARRQVDQPPGADPRRAGRRARAGSRAPATAPTSARPPGSWRRSARPSSGSPATGRTVDLPGRLARAPTACAEPDGILDCGNSGTSLRLISGVLAGLPMTAHPRRRRFVAPPSGRSYHRTAALDGRGAPRPPERLPPSPDRGRSYPAPGDRLSRRPVPSAQVKSAILLAGLRADGRTTVRESVATRDHTERMLRARGVPVERIDAPDGAVAWTVQGGVAVQAVDERVPGDVSAAAFWLVAGAIHPDAELTLRDVGVNPTRRAVIDILRSMGADIEERPHGRAAPDDGVGEPRRRPRRPLVRRSGRSTSARPTWPPRSTRSRSSAWPRPPPTGTTVIRGAGELRHKESDRIAGIAAGLRALGARIEVDGDDLRIDGGTALRGADDRQPRRPPPGDDLRDRRPHRHAARPSIGRPGLGRHLLSRASSTTSKGCEHDEARRPHRPPRGPFAVRRDAAGGLRFARHRRHATSCGTAPRSSWPTPSPSCGRTTSSAPTSRSRTRSGSCRWSTA